MNPVSVSSVLVNLHPFVQSGSLVHLPQPVAPLLVPSLHHPMANNPQQMPLRGTQNAPKFNGKTLAVLPRFLEDVDLLGTAAGINDAKKICYAMRYVDLDEAEVWQMVDAASTTNPVWNDFVDQVKELYLGCEGTNCFCHMDLHHMVQDYCKAFM